MPYYLFKCSKCEEKELVYRPRPEAVAEPTCSKCHTQMVRNYHEERAGPPPPFQAFWDEQITSEPVYVKDKETEGRLLENSGLERFK